MTEPITNELMYEILKKIQADVSHTRERIDDHDQQFISLREQINNLQGDLIRLDKHVMQRLDRIERRLELTDA
jgi:peptidoglycan hydrolase CwlO-like protein